MRDSFDSCLATFTVSGHLILKRHRVKQLNNRNLERHLHHYFGSLWVPARTDGAVARHDNKQLTVLERFSSSPALQDTTSL